MGLLGVGRAGSGWNPLAVHPLPSARQVLQMRKRRASHLHALRCVRWWCRPRWAGARCVVGPSDRCRQDRQHRHSDSHRGLHEAPPSLLCAASLSTIAPVAPRTAALLPLAGDAIVVAILRRAVVRAALRNVALTRLMGCCAIGVIATVCRRRWRCCHSYHTDCRRHQKRTNHDLQPCSRIVNQHPRIQQTG